MSTSTENKNHTVAIAYTATFLGLLLILFLFVIFFTSSKPAQQLDKTSRAETSQPTHKVRG